MFFGFEPEADKPRPPPVGGAFWKFFSTQNEPKVTLEDIRTPLVLHSWDLLQPFSSALSSECGGSGCMEDLVHCLENDETLKPILQAFGEVKGQKSFVWEKKMKRVKSCLWLCLGVILLRGFTQRNIL